MFDSPKNLDSIKKECEKALKAVGLTIGACDVRVQSNSKSTPNFSIIEINSAPAMAEVTYNYYVEEIKKLVNQ